MNKTILRRLLGINETAIYLGITRPTVLALVKRGVLAPVKIPLLDRVMFDQEDLDRMIEEAKVGPPARLSPVAQHEEGNGD